MVSLNLWTRFKCASLTALCILCLQGCELNSLNSLNSSIPIEESPPGMVPAAVAPSLALQLAWSGEQVNLPPPIDAERSVFRNPEFRRWQFRGESEELSYADAQGYKYEVKTTGQSASDLRAGTAKKGSSLSASSSSSSDKPKMRKFGSKSKKKKKDKDTNLDRGQSKVEEGSAGSANKTGQEDEDKKIRPTLKLVVSRHRPDGTLDNITAFRPDGSIDYWVAYGPDGESRLVKVQMRAREFSIKGAPLIQFVNFYDSDRIRQVAVNEHNVAWSEVVVNESGLIRSRLHEDPSKADKVHREEEKSAVK